MTALPRGKVRPPIEAPKIGAEQACTQETSVRIVKLTSYRFCDDSEYTMREFDFRLRWTLYADHRSMTNNGHDTIGHAHVVCEVWSRRDCEWHEVWDFSRQAESPYAMGPTATRRKLHSWNKLWAELAEYVTEVLT